MKKSILMMVCFMFLTGSAFAEEIVLSSGMTVQGVVIERTGNTIKVRASGVDVTYYADEIRSIDGKAFVPPVVSVEPRPGNPSGLTQNSVKSVSEAVGSKGFTATVDRSSVVSENSFTYTAPSANQTLHIGRTSNALRVSSSRSVKARTLTRVQVISIVMIVLMVLGLIFVAACYPVYLIAKKMQAPYPYYAFIPILNYYLLCKISGRPVWWMILYFIPFVGMVIDVIVWMDIATVRQKPNWLGLLILVPLANLGMMWYLAISDQ